MDVFYLEEKFPQLIKIEINGIKTWPLLRILIGYEISKKNFNSKEVFDNQFKSKFNRFRNSFSGWWNCIKKFKKTNFIVYTNLHEKRTLNERFFDRLFHSTIKELGEANVLIIDFCEGKVENIEKSIYKNIVNGDIINYLSIISSRLVSLQISDENRKLIQDVIKEAGITIDYESYFKQFFVKVNLYKKLYKLIKPKCVFTGCYTYYAQVYAAKQLNIKTIEFQHGLINSSHLGYRTLFPYKKEFTPDHLFSFGTDIYKNLDESVYKKQDIKPAGFCYFELLENGFYTKVVIDRNKYDKVVCVPIDSIVENEIVTMVLNIATELRHILFVLAPRATITDNTLTSIAAHQNITYQFSPFQVLIQQSDYHLSIASTCAFESLYFGKPNLLYNANGIARKIMGGVLDESMYSFYFDTEKELVDFLNKDHNFKKDEVKIIGSNFYTSDHTSKIRTYFNELLIN